MESLPQLEDWHSGCQAWHNAPMKAKRKIKTRWQRDREALWTFIFLFPFVMLWMKGMVPGLEPVWLFMALGAVFFWQGCKLLAFIVLYPILHILGHLRGDL